MSWPELDALKAVVTAALDESGALLEANAGFLRLLHMDGRLGEGANVAAFFIQPNFAALLRVQPGAGGEIHRGLLTLSRRAKLGVSCGVKVPVGQGLATHPYRVLALLRSEVTREQQMG